MPKEQKEPGFFSQIKNQLLTTVGLIITAGGGLVVTNIETIFGVNSPDPIEVTATPTVESTKDTIIVLQKTTPKVVVKKVKPKPTVTEKRKKDFDW
mgnify:FL=1|jgi:hypothetical protein|tara:strand:+ start:9325 stop:9612 length:288 start_codon:yes stop_codon:yes gene_type:complete